MGKITKFRAEKIINNLVKNGVKVVVFKRDLWYNQRRWNFAFFRQGFALEITLSAPLSGVLFFLKKDG